MLKYGDGPEATDSDSNLKSDFGHFKILRELGRGGQATVYLATDEKLNRQVALKVMDGAGRASKSHLLRFKREAELASRLDHPGICAIFDAGVSAPE